MFDSSRRSGESRVEEFDWLALLRRGWLLMLLGALVATGLAYLATAYQMPVYRAQASYLVAPSAGVIGSSNEAVINSINTLDRRSTMNTFAEISTSPAVIHRALEALGYGAAQADYIQVRATVLPETFAVQVSVEAADPVQAAAVANALVAEAGLLGAGWYPIFETRVLEVAAPPLQPVWPQVPQTLALAGLVGLGLGLVVAYAVEAARSRLARHETSSTGASASGLTTPVHRANVS